MRICWKTSIFVWILALVMILSLIIGGQVNARPHGSGPSAAHAGIHSPYHSSMVSHIALQQGDDSAAEEGDEADWTGTRYRCVVCHTAYGHNVVMPHPLNPDCSTCHSGTGVHVGCPSCHSMHTVDYPHTTYPSCSECHAGEEVETAQVKETAIGFAAYLFRHHDFFLWDGSALGQ